MYVAAMKHARHTLFAALAGLLLFVLPAYAADPVFPVNSRIGLVPPCGIYAERAIQRFREYAASAAILVAELPAQAYADIEKSFTDEALKSRGMTVEVREPITLKDGRGFLVAGPAGAADARRHDTLMVASVVPE